MNFFSTGKMRLMPDGRWLLEYIGDPGKESYNFAVITLEKTEDDTPEEHIIEGYVNTQ